MSNVLARVDGTSRRASGWAVRKLRAREERLGPFCEGLRENAHDDSSKNVQHLMRTGAD